MRLSRWEPFHPVWNPLSQLHEEMNRLVDRWGNGRSVLATGVFPALNVWEQDDHVVVEAELPGQSLDDLEITVTGGNQLTIKGQRKEPAADKGVWHRRERGFGQFTRTLTLPFMVDADKVEAKLEHGVLTLNLTKHESAKPRKISVQAN